MSDFSRRDELIGWIPGDQAVNSGAVAEEIARLAKENEVLRDRLSKTADATATFSGVTFDEMYRMLLDGEIDLGELHSHVVDAINDTLPLFNNLKPSLLHLLWALQNPLTSGISRQEIYIGRSRTMSRLQTFGLVERAQTPEGVLGDGLSLDGKKFLLRLRLFLSGLGQTTGKPEIEGLG